MKIKTIIIDITSVIVAAILLQVFQLLIGLIWLIQKPMDLMFLWTDLAAQHLSDGLDVCLRTIRQHRY